MYLRPDEVARVLEKAGFTMDVVTQKAYGYRRGDNYVYVNREARMGRTALIIHPALKERSNMLAEPASDIKTCDHYEQFPLYLAGDAQQHYGIPHGFSSRMALDVDKLIRRLRPGRSRLARERLAGPVAGIASVRLSPAGRGPRGTGGGNSRGSSRKQRPSSSIPPGLSSLQRQSGASLHLRSTILRHTLATGK